MTYYTKTLFLHHLMVKKWQMIMLLLGEVLCFLEALGANIKWVLCTLSHLQSGE